MIRIAEHRDIVKSNIFQSFVKGEQQSSVPLITQEQFNNYLDDIIKRDDREQFYKALTIQQMLEPINERGGIFVIPKRALDIEKGGRLDRSKLKEITITDKTGRRQKKWVRRDDDTSEQKPGKGKQEEEVDSTQREEFQAIVDGPGSKASKITKLFEAGARNKRRIAELVGANYSQVHAAEKRFLATQDKQDDTAEDGGNTSEKSPKESKKSTEQQKTSRKEKLRSEISVEDRWEAYETYVAMMVAGASKALVAYGTGGVGKTYTLTKELEANNMVGFDEEVHKPAFSGVAGEGEEPQENVAEGDYDYVKITGKATPTAMYKALYEHNGKLIIFDDCDSVLKNEDAANILKGALDTTGDGTVSYGSAKSIKDEDGNKIPQRFKFTGQVVFISNLGSDEVPQALLSRSLRVDLTMNAGETVERMRQIAPKMKLTDKKGEPLKVTQQDKDYVLDLLDEVKDDIDVGFLNARTFGSLVKTKIHLEKTNPDITPEKVRRQLLIQLT